MLREVLIVGVGAIVAVLGGGLLTVGVFRIVDRAAPAHPADEDSDASVEAAAETLRGGAWIGALERLAIYAGLVAQWPESIAIVLAVKGLARYPELRSGERSAVAERFIIGTFVSVLWACACAGVVHWLIH